MRVSDFYVKYI